MTDDPNDACSDPMCGHEKFRHEFGNGRCRGWSLQWPCECNKFKAPIPQSLEGGRSLVEQYTVKE